MNKVFLIGRLTREPELRYTESNIPVAMFTLAVNRSFTNNDGDREADFINIVVWNKKAENVKNYLNKGSRVAIDGRIQTRSYDNQNEQRRYITEVVANQVEFLESKKESNSTNEDINNSSEQQEEVNPFAEFGEQISIDPNELPFD